MGGEGRSSAFSPMLPSPPPSPPLPYHIFYPTLFPHLIPSPPFPPLPDLTLLPTLSLSTIPDAILYSLTPQLPYPTLASLPSLSLPPPTLPYPTPLPYLLYPKPQYHTIPSSPLPTSHPLQLFSTLPIVPNAPISSHLPFPYPTLPFPFPTLSCPLYPHLTLREWMDRNDPSNQDQGPEKVNRTTIFRDRNGLVPNVFWRGELV